MAKMTKKECASKLEEALKVRTELVEKGLIEDVNEEIKQLVVAGSKEYSKVKVDDILEVAEKIEKENAEALTPEEIVKEENKQDDNKISKENAYAKGKECLKQSRNANLTPSKRKEYFKEAMEYFKLSKA